MSVPIYLFSGPEFGERNDAVSAVKEQLKKKYGSLEEYLYYYVETSVDSALEMLQTESLFSACTCVVYRGAEGIKKKDEIEELSKWIESLGFDGKKEGRQSSVLILVSDEISCDSKLEKLIPKENRKQFWEMFDNRKVPWIKDYFKKNGFIIDDDACEEILDLVENNTEALKAECSRFFVCFPQGSRITVQNVEELITHNRSESAFTLFDAMSDIALAPEKRLENALSILQKLRLSKESSPVVIIAGLSFCFRRLFTWHSLISEYGGVPDEFTCKKNGFTSKKSRTQYSQAQKIWNLGQTAAIQALLSSTDMEIRSGGTNVEETLLELMIYSIVVKKGARPSVYDADWPV